MLSLGVSTRNCLPGSSSRTSGQSRPLKCEACGNPGGPEGAWLEEHGVGTKSKYLCPLCHACLHLDVAGRQGMGAVIWLPEISQEELNSLVLAIFIVMRKAEMFDRVDATKSLVAASLRLYKNFERRAESVQMLLGGSAMQNVMPRQSLSDPAHIAGLLVSIAQKHKLSPALVAKKLDGLRLLAVPWTFEKYIDRCAHQVKRECGVPTWVEAMERDLAAASESVADLATFEATPEDVEAEHAG